MSSTSTWSAWASHCAGKPTAPRRWVSQCAALPAALVLLVAASGCARLPWQQDGAEQSTGEQNVAKVGDQRITGSELDSRIRDDLYEQYFDRDNGAKLHRVRSETLSEMVDEMLLEQAAARDGTTSEAWLDQKLAGMPPVSAEEVAAFFEEHRERLGDDASLEQLSARIRGFLEQQRRAGLIEALRASTLIEIDLARSRFTVEPTGPSRGAADAVVTIVEFSDYECPYCLRAEPTLETLLSRYPDSVRLVHRHLPLSFHRNAMGAALAAVCAEAQDRFWDYHAQLFEHQRELEREQLVDHAAQIGIDVDALAICLDDPQTAARVQRDIEAAGALGASGTPAFFINGIPLTGAQPIENFEAVIDEELRRLQR